MSKLIEDMARAIYLEWEKLPDYARLQMNGILAQDLSKAALAVVLASLRAHQWHEDNPYGEATIAATRAREIEDGVTFRKVLSQWEKEHLGGNDGKVHDDS